MPRSRIARVLLIGTLLVMLLAAATGLWVWREVVSLLQPSTYQPDQALATYANEPAPAKPSEPAAAAFSWNTLNHPPISAQPWIRWWWPGGDVDAVELRNELQQMKAAGFAGAEVQPFTMGMRELLANDPELRARVNAFDTPRYFDLLRGMLKDAQSLGMQIDLTHYSGWPGGSRLVTAQDGIQSLAWSELQVSGGQHISLDIPRPRPSFNAYALSLASLYLKMGDFADFDAASVQLLSVIAARPVGGSHSLISIRNSLQLDPATVQVLDAQVRDGRLSWDVPDGDWIIVASWMLPAGEHPSLIASDPPGYVLDLLRSDGVRAHYNYAFGQRAGLAPFYGNTLRAIFNDSYEYKTDRMVSADFLEEFQRRRGYDLRRYLPSVYVKGADNWHLTEMLPKVAPEYRITDLDARIRYDWQHTLSDLVIERFGQTSAQWAEERGLQSRQQSYGLDIDIIRAQGANDIPETEQLYAGGTREFYRITASAAALYGRNLVSSESFVWPGQDYSVNASKLKVYADNLLASGINHIIYHGFPYDWKPYGKPDAFGTPSWDPWSSAESPQYVFSGNYSPRVPIWNDLPQLNSYLARAQNLLRQGRPHYDVLVYYPFFGYRGRGYGASESAIPMFNGAFALSDPAGKNASPQSDETDDERIAWLRKVRPLLDELERRGLTWGWFNGDALRTRLKPAGQMLGGATYTTLVFAEADAVAPEDLMAARTLMRQHTPVAIYGKAPSHQPGFFNAAEGDATVKAIANELPLGADAPAQFVADLLRHHESPLAYTVPSPILHNSRTMSDSTHIHFFANPTDAPQTVQLRVANTQPQALWWFDALSGTETSASINTDQSLTLQLQPYESRFLVSGQAPPESLGNSSPKAAGPSRAKEMLLSDWSLTVDGKPTRNGLFDWRLNDDLKYQPGPGIYRTQYTLAEPAQGARYVLDLGPVPGSAVVRVNGQEAGRASLPPWRVDVTALLVDGQNTLEIDYQPTLRNALIGRALGGDKRLAHFKSRADALVPEGLSGPIRLYQMPAEVQVESKVEK
ncbi:MAG: glycosyl hydrolase [Pseudomonas sp.]|uniref:glycosyl hydrolase n=1 Tax=Pseudomonas sp. TaxID=306 RepID=UPI0030F0F0BE